MSIKEENLNNESGAEKLDQEIRILTYEQVQQKIEVNLEPLNGLILSFTKLLRILVCWKQMCPKFGWKTSKWCHMNLLWLSVVISACLYKKKV